MKYLLARARRFFHARSGAARAEVFRGLEQTLVDDPVVRVRNIPGKFRIGVRSDLFKRIVLQGEYEVRLVETCLRYCDPRRDGIDVGANIGLYSILMVMSGNCPRVLAIEPTLAALIRLEWNIAANDCSDRIVTFHGAAGESDGRLSLNVIEGREEYSSLGVLEHPSVVGAPCRQIDVPVTTLDELVSRHGLQPGFVKIDVEGMEHTVLRGMRQVCERFRPVVLAELSEPLLRRNGSSGSEVVDMMRRAGYVVTDPVTGGVPGMRAYGDLLCVPVEFGKG